MSSYHVEVLDGEERGIRVTCDEHGESEEFQPGYRSVAFYCDGCGLEVDLTLRDALEWREFTELC